MAYVDGFVAAVPNENKEKFIEHAKIAANVVKEYGALKTVDCWGDDVPDGKLTSLPMSVKKQVGETVVFSWIVWPDKKTRDKGMRQMMEDPRMQEDVNPMPFDGKRCIFGGFEVILEA